MIRISQNTEPQSSSVDRIFADYQQLGMCGAPQVSHNPSLFVDLPTFRKKRSINMFADRGSMFGGLGLDQSPAAPAPVVSNPFVSSPFEPVLQQRIIGGNEAVPHSWPWTAQIVTGEKNYTENCQMSEIGELKHLKK